MSRAAVLLVEVINQFGSFPVMVEQVWTADGAHVPRRTHHVNVLHLHTCMSHYTQPLTSN